MAIPKTTVNDIQFLAKEEVISLDKRGEIKRNLINPPIKDSVVVPDSGFTVLRFLANNPGYWLVHCHMSWHNHLGMGFVVKVRSIFSLCTYSIRVAVS